MFFLFTFASFNKQHAQFGHFGFITFVISHFFKQLKWKTWLHSVTHTRWFSLNSSRHIEHDVLYFPTEDENGIAFITWVNKLSISFSLASLTISSNTRMSCSLFLASSRILLSSLLLFLASLILARILFLLFIFWQKS